jgi:hypothetical protein
MREISEKQTQLREAEVTLQRLLKQLDGASKYRDPWLVDVQPRGRSAKSIEPDIDFGTVERGRVVQRDFPLLNTTGRAVRIAGLRSSHAGLKASAKRIDIPPSEKTNLHIELDTQRFLGEKNFTIFVRFEEDRPPELALRIHAVSREGERQSQDRLQELERKLDALRQEIQDMRRQSRPEKP